MTKIKGNNLQGTKISIKKKDKLKTYMKIKWGKNIYFTQQLSHSSLLLTFVLFFFFFHKPSKPYCFVRNGGKGKD